MEIMCVVQRTGMLSRRTVSKCASASDLGAFLKAASRSFRGQ